MSSVINHDVESLNAVFVYGGHHLGAFGQNAIQLTSSAAGNITSGLNWQMDTPVKFVLPTEELVPPFADHIQRRRWGVCRAPQPTLVRILRRLDRPLPRPDRERTSLLEKALERMSKTVDQYVIADFPENRELLTFNPASAATYCDLGIPTSSLQVVAVNGEESKI